MHSCIPETDVIANYITTNVCSICHHVASDYINYVNRLLLLSSSSFYLQLHVPREKNMLYAKTYNNVNVQYIVEVNIVASSYSCDS